MAHSRQINNVPVTVLKDIVCGDIPRINIRVTQVERKGPVDKLELRGRLESCNPRPRHIAELPLSEFIESGLNKVPEIILEQREVDHRIFAQDLVRPYFIGNSPFRLQRGVWDDLEPADVCTGERLRDSR